MTGKEATSNEVYEKAQRWLISSLLFDGEKTNRVLEIVSAEDFQEPSLNSIMASITEVARNNEMVTPVTVANDLKKRGLLDKVGGISELFALHQEGKEFIRVATPQVYAEIVMEESARYRVTHEVMEEFTDMLSVGSGISVGEAIANAQNRLNGELLKIADDSTTVKIQDVSRRYEDILAQREQTRIENEALAGGLQGIPMLSPSLNKWTSGLKPAQMVTVGARTGVGKTVFAIMTAISAAKAGKSVLFFSLEMGEEELTDRIVANLSSVSLTNLTQGNLDDEEQERVSNALQELEEMKIIIDTDPNTTIDTIRSKAIKQSQSEIGLDIIIIDYLQLITPSNKAENRQIQVAEISRNVKLMAKKLGIPIMILVQLLRAKNNGDEEDKNQLPKVDDIRESGAIAQDSDIVILLHRDYSVDTKNPDTLLILGKNRSGESNKMVRCQSLLQYSMFDERKTQEDAENAVNNGDLDEDIDDLSSYIDDDMSGFDDDDYGFTDEEIDDL